MEAFLTDNYRIICLFLAVGGIGVLMFAATKYFSGQDTAKWPTVQGSIIRSGITQQKMRSRQTGTIGVSYGLDLAYEYSVENKRFVGQDVMYGEKGWWGGTDKDAVRTAAKRFPQSKQVKVYYNPKKPQQAVLIPGIHTRAVISNVTIGVIAFALAAVLWVVAAG
jgi:hypothetical protein